MRDQIQQALDEIRPLIQDDGGDVFLVDVDEKNGVVIVQLQGACCGCPLAEVTLKAGIERMLKERVKGVNVVQAC